MKGRKSVRAAMAEFIAMTLFVWIGCGTAVSVQTQQFLDGEFTQSNDFLTAVSIAFGTAIAVLVYTIASISGGHINPAVTLAFLILRKLTLLETAIYWIAQMLGAMLGAAILWGCTASDQLEDASDRPPFLLASNFVDPELPLGSAFLIEAMGTFLLVWTVMMSAVSKHSMAGNLAPIAIGWSVMLAHFVLIPFTGCGINPARSFGPHVVSAMAGADVSTRGTWIFYTAPFVGSAVATFLGQFMIESEKDVDEEEAAEREHEAIEKSLISGRVPAPTYARKVAPGSSNPKEGSKMEKVEEEEEKEGPAEVEA